MSVGFRAGRCDEAVVGAAGGALLRGRLAVAAVAASTAAGGHGEEESEEGSDSGARTNPSAAEWIDPEPDPDPDCSANKRLASGRRFSAEAGAGAGMTVCWLVVALGVRALTRAATEERDSAVREDNWDSCEGRRPREEFSKGSCPLPSWLSSLLLLLLLLLLWWWLGSRVGADGAGAGGGGSDGTFLATEEDEDDDRRSNNLAVNRDSRPSASGMMDDGQFGAVNCALLSRQSPAYHIISYHIVSLRARRVE